MTSWINFVISQILMQQLTSKQRSVFDQALSCIPCFQTDLECKVDDVVSRKDDVYHGFSVVISVLEYNLIKSWVYNLNLTGNQSILDKLKKDNNKEDNIEEDWNILIFQELWFWLKIWENVLVLHTMSYVRMHDLVNLFF